MRATMMKMMLRRAREDEDVRGKREAEEREGEYEVEAILDKKVTRGGTGVKSSGVARYLVKWKNYDDTHNSWEREENLRGCGGLVRAFERKLDVREAAERGLRRSKRVQWT